MNNIADAIIIKPINAIQLIGILTFKGDDKYLHNIQAHALEKKKSIITLPRAYCSDIRSDTIHLQNYGLSQSEA